MSKKKKKEKIVYYDDNSTISDMSNVGRKRRIPTTAEQKGGKPPSAFRDKWNTYWDAVKLMVMPMLAVLAVLSAIFLVLFLLAGG